MSCSGGSGGLGGKRKAGVVLVFDQGFDPVLFKWWAGFILGLGKIGRGGLGECWVWIWFINWVIIIIIGPVGFLGIKSQGPKM